MIDTCRDLHAEYRELATLCRELTPAQWQLRSTFFGWTPWDEVAHLCFFDATGLLAVTDPDAFARDTQALSAQLATGLEISAIARAKYANWDGAALLAQWEALSDRLVQALAGLDPKARLPWYGPMMSARSFATARLMETWAHGQDVWDVLARRRVATARLKHIAHIGVTTFGWSFVNRQRPVPAQAPRVELQAPDGSTWTWGDAASGQFVRGDASEFCLVVTQRRNVLDTALQASDGAAREWLSIAQCFAGPPADPPAPEARGTVHRD